LSYRKLASQWLLVSLGAVGFVLSKEHLMPVQPWVLVISICLAASVGILVLWMLDLKVYHELLHAAFKEGVKLENDYPEFLPQIRNNMVNSQTGGDVIARVIYYYYFSILLLLIIANVATWMIVPIKSNTSGGMETGPVLIRIGVNILSVIMAYLLYRLMTKSSQRSFKDAEEADPALATS
jgi:ABC-type microcin C transport system permease subunit YejE